MFDGEPDVAHTLDMNNTNNVRKAMASAAKSVVAFYGGNRDALPTKSVSTVDGILCHVYGPDYATPKVQATVEGVNYSATISKTGGIGPVKTWNA